MYYSGFPIMWMAIILDEGKSQGLRTPSNLHSLYHLKPVEAKCNKEYLDDFHLKHLKSYEVMKGWYREEENFIERVRITKYNPKNFISPV